MSHPNRRPFIGVLTVVDAPSEKAPNGARGHRVILTSAAAKSALLSLIGMGINFGGDSGKHRSSEKIGVIDSAELHRNEIIVSGYIWGRDCPEVVASLSASSEYGMSYEMCDARIEDMRQPIWTIIATTFTGASIIRRSSAAYQLTDFVLL